MHERLRPTLALLDQGLALYRRHFTSFLLVAAVWFVPTAILVGLGVALITRVEVLPMFGLIILGVLLLLVLLIYLMGVLSRAANLALDDQPIRLREVFRIPPLHLLGMAIFSMIYTILSQIAMSIFSTLLACPLYMIFLLVAAVFGSSFNSSSGLGATGGMVFGVLMVVLVAALYMVGIFMSGASLGGMIYGLQAWAYGYRSLGMAIQNGINMIAYRFIKNVGIWGCAAIVMLGAGTAITTLLTIVLPIPVAMLLGEDSILTNSLVAATWLMGSLLVLPPMPIWMALLYRSNLTLREGADLQGRVDTWWRQIQTTAQPLEG
ncbi:hypothetical protein F8S13_05755 [Chloroflexia bacterium SDU3-3]|nr:hypothetical protein F8S13_05755 [Chloroflexia bacterium SDU3-3]